MRNTNTRANVNPKKKDANKFIQQVYDVLCSKKNKFMTYKKILKTLKSLNTTHVYWSKVYINCHTNYQIS